MKEIIRYGITLFVISVITSAVLAGVYSLTKDKILAQALTEEEQSLKEVLPIADKFELCKSDNEIIYYKGYNKAGKLVGVAFKASGKGYSSTIETMIGMQPDGAISGIKVLSQNETPGVGAQVAEPPFLSQFLKKHTDEFEKINAISSATISSQAVINSVRGRVEEAKKLIP